MKRITKQVVAVLAAMFLLASPMAVFGAQCVAGRADGLEATAICVIINEPNGRPPCFPDEGHPY